MKKSQIDRLIERCTLPDSCHNLQLKETHISWVVLTDHYAFKVKKPVRLNFLDFSTKRKRKHYCMEEVDLNRRLVPDMYLGVIPVTAHMLGERENGEEDWVIDYAVQMKRMENDREMDKLLQKKKVSLSQLDKLAEKVARFHRNTRIIKDAFDTTGFQDKFTDLISEIGFIETELGKEWGDLVKSCNSRSNTFLNASRSYFNQRIITNFRRDCHGDLNASNIFLYDDPVIFDCIEFNREYRHIDILNEIAFLCVDLDYYGDHSMSEHFYRKYLDAYGMKEDEPSRRLFMYYKTFRANVRAKVCAIRAQQAHENGAMLRDVKKYIEMMSAYSSEHGESAL